jgi:hypothetical protein
MASENIRHLSGMGDMISRERVSKFLSANADRRIRSNVMLVLVLTINSPFPEVTHADPNMAGRMIHYWFTAILWLIVCLLLPNWNMP